MEHGCVCFGAGARGGGGDMVRASEGTSEREAREARQDPCVTEVKIEAEGDFLGLLVCILGSPWRLGSRPPGPDRCMSETWARRPPTRTHTHTHNPSPPTPLPPLRHSAFPPSFPHSPRELRFPTPILGFLFSPFAYFFLCFFLFYFSFSWDLLPPRSFSCHTTWDISAFSCHVPKPSPRLGGNGV